MPHTILPASVLIVDDQPANLLALEAVLQSLQVNLVRAESGPLALAALDRQDAAAILLDVRMPGMDGFEVARQIRARPRTRSTPILFVTAGDDPDDAMLDAYRLGAVDFLAKPLQPEILKAKVGVFVDLYRSKEELRLKERKLFEQRLQANEELYRTLFESIDEGFCVIEVLRDAEGTAVDFRFEEANEAFVLHTGLGPDAVGRTMRELVPDHEDEWYRMYGDVATTGQPVRMVQEAAALGRWFDVYATRLGPPGSERVAVLFSDITQRRSAEQDLRRLAEELERANRRKTEFLATLAHELRNPLAPLSNGLHLMKMAAGNAQMLERTREMMERQVQHMVHLVDDLLDVARISTGKVELRRRLVDLRDVIANAVEASQSLISIGGHRFTLELPESPLMMNVDPTRIAQVTSNLLNNAAKYTVEPGDIHLSLIREQEQAVLTVRDTGIGIAREALPQVFEMFAQVSAGGARPQGGLGIGLSLVQSLVALHGGTVEACSEGMDRGSVFKVRLPVQSEARSDGSAGDQPLERPARQLRVLVVDDNQDAAESLGMLLEMEGHSTHLAHDGRQALELAQSLRPDVVFLDIGLPDLSGYDVARQLRTVPALAAMRLVALTGWGTQEDRDRSRDAGFDHHLTKPAELHAVEALLRDVALAIR